MDQKRNKEKKVSKEKKAGKKAGKKEGGEKETGKKEGREKETGKKAGREKKENRWKQLQWARTAGIRGLKNMARTAIAVIGTSVFIQEVNWLTVASASALAGILSLLASISEFPETDFYGTDF